MVSTPAIGRMLYHLTSSLPRREDGRMRRYAVTVSYATMDRYYRGQRAFIVHADSECDARQTARMRVPHSEVIRIRECVNRAFVARVLAYCGA